MLVDVSTAMSTNAMGALLLRTQAAAQGADVTTGHCLHQVKDPCQAETGY